MLAYFVYIEMYKIFKIKIILILKNKFQYYTDIRVVYLSEATTRNLNSNLIYYPL